MDVTNSVVTWTLGVPQWTTDVAFKQKTISAPVYIMWRPFNRFLSYSLTGTNNVLRSQTELAKGSNVLAYKVSAYSATEVITGIPRPPMSTLKAVNGNIHFIDLVAVFYNVNYGPAAGATGASLMVPK